MASGSAFGEDDVPLEVEVDVACMWKGVRVVLKADLFRRKSLYNFAHFDDKSTACTVDQKHHSRKQKKKKLPGEACPRNPLDLVRSRVLPQTRPYICIDYRIM